MILPEKTATIPATYGAARAAGFAPRERSEAKCCLAKSIICKSTVSCCHCQMGELDYVFSMSTGILKRSFIALVVLALASAWQVSPSFASRPCGMDDGTALAASGSCCNSVAGDCTKATSCCGISTNLAMPPVPSVTPIDWVGVARRDDVQSLAGRRLQPDLHPPTTHI